MQKDREYYKSYKKFHEDIEKSKSTIDKSSLISSFCNKKCRMWF